MQALGNFDHSGRLLLPQDAIEEEKQVQLSNKDEDSSESEEDE